MKRRVTDGKLSKRGKYWQWRFYLDGKQRWVSLKTTSKAEAQEMRRALIARYQHPELADQVTPDPAPAPKADQGNPTCAEFWERYSAAKATRVRQSTLWADGYAFRAVAEHAGAARVGDIRREHVETLLASMVSGEHPSKPTTANRLLRHFKAAMNFGIERGIFAGPNPAQGVKPLRTERKVPTFLDEEQVAALLRHAQEHSRDMFLVVCLGYYLGLRKSEIVHAKWEWLRGDKTCKIASEGTFRLKDHEERVIPVSDEFLERIAIYRQSEGYIFEDRSRNRPGSRYRWDPQAEFRAVADAAGLPECTIQQLRRSFGSRLIDAGVSMTKVSRWLGHSSVVVTERHYIGVKKYDDEINRLSIETE